MKGNLVKGAVHNPLDELWQLTDPVSESHAYDSDGARGMRAVGSEVTHYIAIRWRPTPYSVR